MARGFIGGQFGPSPVPSTARPANLSGMFSLDDAYYIHQNGGWAEPTGIIASGGVINDYPSGGNIYRAHVFLGSGTYTVSRQSNDPTIPSSQDVLVVGAGGAGATRCPGPGKSGGGGGGGVSEGPGKTLADGDYKVIIGAGGAPGGDTGSGLTGGDTFFGPPSPGSAGTSPPNGVTCLGGGGGGSNTNGEDGGNGGGAGGNTSGPQQSTGTQPTVTQGIPGFTQYGYPGPYAGDPAQSAGGGGIEGQGGQMHGPWGSFAGSGKNGRDWNWATGSNIHYGAGGGSQAGATTPTRMSAGGGIDFPYPSGPVGGPFLPTAGDARSNWPTNHRPDPTVNYYPYGAVSPFNGWIGRGGGGAGMCNSPAHPEGSPYSPNGVGGYGGSGSVTIRYKVASVQTGTAKASGGDISFYAGKAIHTFTTSGTFQVSNPTAVTVEYFMIGGGGGGGQGGGGAGGFLTGPAPVSPGSPNKVTVTVGGGGQGFGSHPDPTPFNGFPGGDTILAGGITARAAGGGGGQCDSADGTAASAEGGSGGGGKAGGEGGTGATYPEVNYPTNPSPGGSAPGQGYAGGDGGPTADAYGGGGGGGAGGAGTAGTAPAGGNGGIGLQLPTSFRDPKSNVGGAGPNGEGWWVGGGGGGGSRSPDYTTGEGGGPGGPYAGAGEGGTFPAKGQTAAIQGSGGGGGGCAGPSAPTGPAEVGGQGGSGIVLIAYDV